ncbi:rust resistance kinase Lr10-like isoform X1 [Triticum aestivum]|uniref:rust resistance kinase Lr10-like isoform X1 n=3 Tax=Triticum aestivum TaxID=4565 RepID=UPI001D011ABF|nr:rust resistance kinase Lr10-like isoform X1 [Triticum aestivum]XP_044338219.1 rust resistance kinase Lr10-like isoform X1 [Triticum aestivum]XP_044338220.1 rust resistance kinase Lr10-like isoform X1 [Triticum aestivum]XP_044338221.1 rust resistance kinase Lr10-like isoform X1 [Triticum aestivum]
MTNSVAFPCSVILQALAISSTVSVFLTKTGAEDTPGQAVCPSFSCGHLQDIHHPFRLRGDPPGCGFQEYELVCSDDQAIIQVNTGRYFITNISYPDSVFWVVDASLDNSSCPIPERNQHSYIHGLRSYYMFLLYMRTVKWAAFVSCSRMMKDNLIYKPIACRSTNTSFVYVLSTMQSYQVQNVEPSCGYLAMTPLGSWRPGPNDYYASYDYEDIVKFMRDGFALRFPFPAPEWTYSWILKTCLENSRSVGSTIQMQLALGPTRYAYTDITAITSHFKEKLGQGGYGSVYKGVLPGDVHVAIKMLVSSMSNGEEFISEVSSIGSIHHVNVVRLVGFCSEKMRRALVYEYMPHGSLEKYIFSPEKSFSSDKLNQIALGIARGIDYLHRGCDMQILHFDIKPHNILLDSDFTPKIADFGLAKLYPRDNSFLPVSAARGTVGYIAPEMVSRSFGAISSKSDVYSFGMLLLEMAGGRRNVDPQASRSQTYYPSWVYNQLSRQEAVGIHQVERKLCVVALWCIQMKPDDRPAMSEVLDMLEAGIDGLEMPPEPFFCGDEYAPAADSSVLSELSTLSE